MGATGDCIYTALAVYPGSLNEKIAAWLEANGATGSTLNDLWMDFLSAGTGSLNDRKLAWYKAQGATGSSLKDVENNYWCVVALPG